MLAFPCDICLDNFPIVNKTTLHYITYKLHFAIHKHKQTIEPRGKGFYAENFNSVIMDILACLYLYAIKTLASLALF